MDTQLQAKKDAAWRKEKEERKTLREGADPEAVGDLAETTGSSVKRRISRSRGRDHTVRGPRVRSPSSSPGRSRSPARSPARLPRRTRENRSIGEAFRGPSVFCFSFLFSEAESVLRLAKKPQSRAELAFDRRTGDDGYDETDQNLRRSTDLGDAVEDSNLAYGGSCSCWRQGNQEVTRSRQ